MEFLYFYLMPETPSLPRAGDEGNLLQRSSSELGRAFAARPPSGLGLGLGAGANANGNGNGNKGAAGDPFAEGGEAESDTLSCERKQDMLGQHLSNVADLVKDLEQYTPGFVGK